MVSDTKAPGKKKSKLTPAGTENKEPADQASLPLFLSVRQLAALLHINEKKVYQLAAEGDIPCTKVTGKWIFPTRLIEDWINENSHGGVMTDRMVIAGADDPQMDQVCRQLALDYRDSAMLSYSPYGVLHGLKMLESGRCDATLVHWGSDDNHGMRHLGFLRSFRNHRRWVAVRCLQRQEVLAVNPDTLQQSGMAFGNRSSAKTNRPGSADAISLSGLLAQSKWRWAIRHPDSGSHRYLQDLCSEHRIDLDQLTASIIATSDRQAGDAVASGCADAALLSESTALASNLPYLPAGQVNIDLVTTRKTYFRKMIQQLLHRLIQLDPTAADNSPLEDHELNTPAGSVYKHDTSALHTNPTKLLPGYKIIQPQQISPIGRQ